MTIILIGNYKSDKQESMERFAQMMYSGIKESGHDSVIWRPVNIFGAPFSTTIRGIGKWAGYLDKWIMFPLILKWRIFGKKYKSNLFSFHICDHSNAPYLQCLPIERTVITCHDVLAILGALGHKNTFCEASTLGKILQKWILKHLSSAKKLAADSQQTLDQLQSLVPQSTCNNKVWQVIHIGFNDDFKPHQTAKTIQKLKDLKLLDNPFILHVGSSLPRKNRKLLIDLATTLNGKWNGNICYAGEETEPELLSYADSFGLRERIVNVIKPDHEILTTLYTRCDAFIFPSYSEGFGWPLIEAQACGAPVIASNIEPMPEISNGTAIHCDPKNPRAFADAYIWLQNQENRIETINAGFKNIIRFEQKKMTQAYLKLYSVKQLKN